MSLQTERLTPMVASSPGWTLEVWDAGGWVHVGVYGTRKAAVSASAKLALPGKRRITFKRSGGAQ